ncbi:MAG: hypothetical protein FJ303_16995 [Planctomycetes bacterium]|nr:hypothetical protein [Planctomycetota bacterium]
MMRDHFAARDRGEEAARDSIASVYLVVFEPVNLPFRYVLPRGGRYHLFDLDNRAIFLDLAPLMAAIVVIVGLILALNWAEKVMGLDGPDVEISTGPPPSPPANPDTKGK